MSGTMSSARKGPQDEATLLRHFRAHHLFGALPEAALLGLVAEVVERVYRKGQRLFYPGDPASYVFVVRSGLIALTDLDLSGNECVVLTYSRGDVFGQVAITLGLKHTRTATAMMEAGLLLVPKDSFLRLYRGFPQLADLLLRELSEMLSRSQKIAVDAALTPVSSRVARFLLDVSTRDGYRESEGFAVELELSHVEIALLIGTSRETITRIIARLARAGIIDVKRRRLAILKPEALRRLANGRA